MYADGGLPADASSEEQEALQLMRSGRLEQSRAMLETLCARFPHRAKFHFNHALALYKLKRYKEALQAVTTGLKVQPDDDKAIRFKQALVALAREAASEGIRDARPGPGARDALPITDAAVDGNTMAALARDDGTPRGRAPVPARPVTPPVPPPIVLPVSRPAIQPPTPEAREAIEEPTSAAASASVGELSKVRMAEVLGIIQKIGAGLESGTIKDDDPGVKEKIARIKQETQLLYEHAHYEQALTIYTMLLRFFPDDLEALFNCGFCLREMQSYAEAETTFKHVIDVYYDNAYAWYNLALIYALTNDEDKETYCLQKASEFGYPVNNSRLYNLTLMHVPKNPFDAD